MLSQIYASIGSRVPQKMKQCLLNYQNLLRLLWKFFLCRLFLQMIETIYVLTYIKINHIFFVIKVTAHSNNRNSKSSREVILGSVRLRQSVILRNYDMFSTDSNARYTARW